MNSIRAHAIRPDASTASDVPRAEGQARHYHARLLMCDGRRYCALTEEGAIWVVAAASCLLQPAVGDIALVSIAGTGGYVLSILERAHPEQDAVVSMPGTLRLHAEKVEIAAREALSIDAGASLKLKAATAGMQYQALSVEGEILQTRWKQRADVAKERIEIASYSETHSGRSIRRIATHEEVTAASFRQTVTRDWTVNAGTSGLMGRDRVAIDGNSVQIG